MIALRQPTAPADAAVALTPFADATHAGGLMPDAARAADFEYFYAATAARIVRHAYALTGNIADAQDIASEAMARAWQRWPAVSRCESPEAWVRRVASNLATSRWRRAQAADAAARQFADRAAVIEIGPDTVALVAALRTLPDRQRVAIVLYYLADLSVDQVAAELGCPAGSVKAWLSRGRAALALALADDSAPARRAGTEAADA